MQSYILIFRRTVVNVGLTTWAANKTAHGNLLEQFLHFFRPSLASLLHGYQQNCSSRPLCPRCQMAASGSLGRRTLASGMSLRQCKWRLGPTEKPQQRPTLFVHPDIARDNTNLHLVRLSSQPGCDIRTLWWPAIFSTSTPKNVGRVTRAWTALLFPKPHMWGYPRRSVMTIATPRPQTHRSHHFDQVAL